MRPSLDLRACAMMALAALLTTISMTAPAVARAARRAHHDTPP